MALTPQQRYELGLDDAPPALEGEFEQPTGGPLYPSSEYKVNAKLALKEADKATAPKIRQLVNELLACNMQNADKALQQLFVANPKAALELYLELMAFSVPQLKAVAVALDDRTERPQAMDYNRLLQIVQGDG